MTHLPRVNVDVRALGADAAVLITPDGRMFEIGRPATEVVRALEDLAATSPDASPPWPELAALLTSTGSLIEPPAPFSPAESPPTSAPPAETAQTSQAPVLLTDAALRPIVTALAAPGEQIGFLDDDVPHDRPMALLSTRFDPELLARVDDRRTGAWSCFFLDQGRCYFGPAVEPGRSAPYRDLLTRRACVTQRPDLAEALLRPSLTGGLRPPPPDVLTWLVSLFLAELRRWLAGEPCALAGNEIEVDPAGPEIRLHPFLPLPAGPFPEVVNHRVTGTDLLLGDRLGIVAATRVIEHDPSIPRTLTTVQADVADMSRRFPWATNVLCGASTFGDVAGARAAAIGESVERYCANWIQPERLRQASYAELRRAGENAVAPESIVLFSEAQYAADGFPFVRFDAGLPVRWIAGRSLTHDRPVWVPASLAYCNYYVGPYYHEPVTNPLYYAGVAAGKSFDDAVRSGLEEVIERDATMVWWANLPALPSLEPTPRLAALFDGTKGQRAWLVPLPNEFGVPVIAGVVEHVEERILTIGFGCRDTVEPAAEKAWAEALTLQEIARDLQDPAGLYWEAVRAGRKTRHFMHEWRADRAYLDSFRPDFRDVGDLECQLQVNLDPRAVERVRDRLGGGSTTPASAVPALPDRSLRTYRQRVERAGYEVIAVDLTTPDVAAAGLHVTRTLVPGLAGNFAAAFPYLGADRLRDAATKFGWPARTELNVFPLPHA
ncbi:ribosomal protein S12 methylthiotransferase accessory factor [Nonomuraea fuscirosea]|uniref:Ribosomal protein S12 methylthiotransferase accessory factor n=1 Tax=Nonomuraea fuscirosea TaxID=1291556 RepID=A0A2T0MQX7_9ACTN|nr:YcaO-like family protein [Nonomuraea fuscirosea]PRX60654.1 ribosomal protein S12 methylthiotransferase accessory factor [Nonomuraea fuscirosea]